MKLYGIFQRPGRAAHARRARHGLNAAWHGLPEPKRVSVIEAESEREALLAFHRAEQTRSSHVGACQVVGKGDNDVWLAVIIVNGYRNAHLTRYDAWEVEVKGDRIRVS